MHAGLALQVAVGVVALDVQRGAADAGFVVAQLVDDLGLVAVTLGPAAVHAQEHLGPVASLGAAGAGLDPEVGVAGVLRPAQHRLQLEVVEPSSRACASSAVQLGLEAGILLGQLGQGLEVADGGFQLLERLEQAVERLELLDDLLGFFRIVPEVGLRPSGRLSLDAERCLAAMSKTVSELGETRQQLVATATQVGVHSNSLGWRP